MAWSGVFNGFCVMAVCLVLKITVSHTQTEGKLLYHFNSYVYI